MNTKLVEDLTAILKREKAVQSAVLFGSHAAGHSRPESDIDVAVWLGDQLDSRQMEDARLHLSLLLMDHFHCEVDLVLLDTAPPFLQQQIYNKGIELFAKDRSTWNEYRVKGYMAAFSMRRIMDIQFLADRKKLDEELKHG